MLTAMSFLHRAQCLPFCNPCALCQEARAVAAATDAPVVVALMPVATVAAVDRVDTRVFIATASCAEFI